LFVFLKDLFKKTTTEKPLRAHGNKKTKIVVVFLLFSKT